jgi:type I restriction enzyme S subunit
MMQLVEVAKISAGNSAPQAKNAFKNGVIPFIRTSDVGQIHKGEISDSRDMLPRESISKFKLFPAGTILMPKSGASTFLNHRVKTLREAAISSHLAGIVANPEIIREDYLYHYLTLVDARDLVQDASYPSLNLGQIGGIQIPVPPLAVQDDIVAKVKSLLSESAQISLNLVNQERLRLELEASVLRTAFGVN